MRRATDWARRLFIWRSGASACPRGARPVLGEAGVVGERLFETRARIRLLRRGGSGEDQRGEGQRRSASHYRSVAPVFLPTSATTLATAASISESVSVRSRGCSVTAIATDFCPSGTPAPR